MAKVETGLIDVKVVYPSAHRPAVKEFAPETTVRQVKDFALTEFGLTEETLPDGNKIVFFIYFGNTKLENLDQAISSFEHPNHKVDFRLAKEVIAGC
jgi:hypothetical protein